MCIPKDTRFLCVFEEVGYLRKAVYALSKFRTSESMCAGLAVVGVAIAD